MFLKVDTKDVRKLESDLQTFKRRAFPYATRETVNRGAFTGRKIARDIAKGRFVLRNAWTRKSIQVEKARTLYVPRQYATLGSVAPYMETQEFGKVLTSTGKRGRPIATPTASGESSLPRRRLPRRANKLANIKLGRGRVRAANRKARNRAAVQEAAARGRGSFVFLDLGRRSGIYKVTGGKRRPRIRKIWDLSRRSVVIRPRPWLLPATEKAMDQMPRYYRDALLFQLRRHGVFGY